MSHLSERLQLVPAEEFWQSVVSLLFIAAKSYREAISEITAQVDTQATTISALQRDLTASTERESMKVCAH